MKMSKKEIKFIEAELQHLMTGSITTGIVDLEVNLLLNKLGLSEDVLKVFKGYFESKQKEFKTQAASLISHLGGRTPEGNWSFIVQLYGQEREVGLFQTLSAPVLNLSGSTTSPEDAEIIEPTPESTTT